MCWYLVCLVYLLYGVCCGCCFYGSFSFSKCWWIRFGVGFVFWFSIFVCVLLCGCVWGVSIVGGVVFWLGWLFCCGWVWLLVVWVCWCFVVGLCSSWLCMVLLVMLVCGCFRWFMFCGVWVVVGCWYVGLFCWVDSGLFWVWYVWLDWYWIVLLVFGCCGRLVLVGWIFLVWLYCVCGCFVCDVLCCIFGILDVFGFVSGVVLCWCSGLICFLLFVMVYGYWFVVFGGWLWIVLGSVLGMWLVLLWVLIRVLRLLVVGVCL